MNKSKITNIFVDCHVFDAGFQGTRTYIKGLYQELINDQDKHFFFAASNIEVLRKEFGEKPNITYLKYNSHSKIYRLLIDTPRLIRKNKIEFAHFQYRVPPVKLCKYIVTTHDVLFEDFPEYFPVFDRFSSLITYKFSAKISEIVFTVSEYSKTQIKKYLGVPESVVMPNGVSEVFYEPYDKDEVKLHNKNTYGLNSYFIYISRHEPRKNQHLLLKYFTELGLHEKHQLVFVGHQTFRNEKFETIYNELDEQIRQKIITIDHAGFPEMLSLLRGSEAFIYPSIAEGFGIPPLEAAAARIPVLCSDQTAMSDFGFFGQNLFNPLNEKEFMEKLQTLANDAPSPVQLEDISNEIRQKYNWHNAAVIFNNELKKFR